MDIIQLGALAIVAALCAVMVRQKLATIGLVLALATCAILFLGSLSAFEEMRKMIDELGEMAGLSQTILSPVVKTVGIAIVTKLSSEVCRDAKENGIASFVELAGAAAAIVLAIPLLRMVLEMIGGLL